MEANVVRMGAMQVSTWDSRQFDRKKAAEIARSIISGRQGAIGISIVRFWDSTS